MQAAALFCLVALACHGWAGDTLPVQPAAKQDTEKAPAAPPPATANPVADKAAASTARAPAAANVVVEKVPAPAPATPAELPKPDAPHAVTAQAAPAAKVPEPIPSSQPVPFTIDANAAPAATNDQNFFRGFPDVQDLSDLLPGNFANTKYKWYGFVRLDAIFDYNPIASTDDFVTSSIPVPQGRGQNAVLTPRYTRLGFDTSTPWECMDWTIKTRIEVDFFNGNTSGVFGSFPLRLRFAWIDFGPFLVGQAASLFMDYSVFPNVLDYEGPPGMVLMRQPIFSMHWNFCEKFKVSVGIEQPYSDIQWFEAGRFIVNPGTGIITTPGVGRNVQDMPDFTGNVRYEGDYSHVQVAGILRKLTFLPGNGEEFNRLGYGINVTGSWYPWAMWHHTPRTTEDIDPLLKSHFLGQYAVGKGISRYIQDINGLGLDATFDPVNGFHALTATGWFIAYEHWWAKRWASNFTVGGEAHVQVPGTLPGSTYKEANYYSANIIWLPVDRMGVGFEYLYGMRQDKNGLSGHAHRLQAGIQYRF
jgi:hypothetical protein